MNAITQASREVAPQDLHLVRSIAAAVLEHQGLDPAELLDLVVDENAPGYNRRAVAAANLAAQIVNYLRGEFGLQDVDHELLAALRKEAGL